MTIQFNADNNLTIHEGFREKLKDQLTEALSRFTENITRLEVHLSDENGAKQSLQDKKCLIEARVERRAPFVVSALADTYELAVNAAGLKLEKLLDSMFDRMKNH